MDRIEKIAGKVAKEMTAAVKDLAELRALIPELREKQKEYDEKAEKLMREKNMMWGEITRDIFEGTQELVGSIKSELIRYFKESGKGVRTVGSSDNGVEVFVGSDDGVRRYQSKVWCNIFLTFGGSEKATFSMRNETLDDIDMTLSDKSTVAKMMQAVKAADKKGFWNGSAE